MIPYWTGWCNDSTCTLKVPDSNLWTGYWLSELLCGFLQSFQVNVRIVLKMTVITSSWILPYWPFMIIFQSNLTSEVETVSLNSPRISSSILCTAVMEIMSALSHFLLISEIVTISNVTLWWNNWSRRSGSSLEWLKVESVMKTLPYIHFSDRYFWPAVWQIQYSHDFSSNSQDIFYIRSLLHWKRSVREADRSNILLLLMMCNAHSSYITLMTDLQTAHDPL